MSEATIPLLAHPLDDPSVFTPAGLLDAVRVERGLARAKAPRVCVLEFDGDLTDWLVSRGAARPSKDWACFHTALFLLEVDGQPCGIVPRTIGGPYAVLVAEQLLAWGVEVIVGLTSAGRVDPKLAIPSLLVATSAVRDEGTSYHYLPAAAVVDAPKPLAEQLGLGLRVLGFPVNFGRVWTTDAPYRETRAQLAEHARTGVSAVEMQAASLFAFGQAKNAAVAVVAQISNAVDHAGQPFDKGGTVDANLLLEAIFQVGLRYLPRPESS